MRRFSFVLLAAPLLGAAAALPTAEPLADAPPAVGFGEYLFCGLANAAMATVAKPEHQAEYRDIAEANFARAQAAAGAGDLDYPAILEAETAKYQAEMDEYDADMRSLKPILDLNECDEFGLQE